MSNSQAAAKFFSGFVPPKTAASLNVVENDHQHLGSMTRHAFERLGSCQYRQVSFTTKPLAHGQCGGCVAGLNAYLSLGLI